MPVFVYFRPTKDTSISQRCPNKNFGNDPCLYIDCNYGPCNHFESLIEFDLCSLPCNGIPVDSTLDPNFLFLYICQNGLRSTTRLYAYRIKSQWGEQSVTWNLRPLVDYSNPVGYVDISPGDYGEVQMTLDPDVVTKWYNGYYMNNGLLLTCNGNNNCNNDGFISFYSKEYICDPDLWPKLAVCYSQNCCDD